MHRRELLKFLLTQPVLAEWPAALGRSDGHFSDDPLGAVLRNSHFELACGFVGGLQCRLVHLETGSILADGSYFYSFGCPVFSRVERDSSSLVLEGVTQTGLVVSQRFLIDAEAPFLKEEIQLTNQASRPCGLHDLR